MQAKVSPGRLKPSHILKSNRGIALLITLSIIAVLIAATFELNRKVRSTVVNTATARDKLTLSHIASSGISVGMAILIKDKKSDPPSGMDSVQEDWARPEKISEILQDIPFEKGSVSIKITDELGKLQVNALLKRFPGHEENKLQRELWDNLLRPIVSKDEDTDINATTDIINAVKDWLDSEDNDAVTGFNGAESDHYEDLDPPYSCKNGPFTHINELLMVKGITPELFSGTEGISDYLTIFGAETKTKPRKTTRKTRFSYDGKININTAELPVLVALVGPDNMEYAQAIYDYRQEKDDTEFVNSLSGTRWYKEAPGIPEDFNIKSGLIRTSSDYFQIESTGSLFEMKMTITAVVHREKNKDNKWKCSILSWETGNKSQANTDEQKDSWD